MASRNRFSLLALDDEDYDVIDAADIEAVAYLTSADAAADAAALPALLGSHAPVPGILANPAPAAADHGTAPGTEDLIGDVGLFGGKDVNQVFEDNDPLNPWKVVKYKDARKRDKLNKEDSPVTIDGKACIEVPWEPETGPLRRVRKHAQERKGGYVPTDEGPGVYVYGSIGPDGLQF